MPVLEPPPSVQELRDAVLSDVLRVHFRLFPIERRAEREETHCGLDCRGRVADNDAVLKEGKIQIAFSRVAWVSSGRAVLTEAQLALE